MREAGNSYTVIEGLQAKASEVFARSWCRDGHDYRRRSWVISPESKWSTDTTAMGTRSCASG